MSLSKDKSLTDWESEFKQWKQSLMTLRGGWTWDKLLEKVKKLKEKGYTVEKISKDLGLVTII